MATGPRIEARAQAAPPRDYLAELAPQTGDALIDAVERRHARREQNYRRIVRRDAARGPARRAESGRRTRLRAGVHLQLAGWLHRTARVHAHLCAIVRLYGRPDRAGGQSNQGETYAARAAAGDRTLLYDCLTVSRDELDAIRGEVEAAMEAAAPTSAPPGTTDKVSEMARRAERGESLFIQGDGPRPDDGSPGG